MGSVSLAPIKGRLQAARPDFVELTMVPDGNVFLSDNLVGDYSVTPQDAWVVPEFSIFGSLPQFFVATDFGVRINTGTSPVRTDYGTIASGLTNGIDLWIESDEIVRTSIAALMFDNQALSDYFKQHQIYPFAANSDTHFSLGAPIFGLGLIAVARNGHIGVTLNDDFSSLVKHQWFVRGFYTDVPERWIEAVS